MQRLVYSRALSGICSAEPRLETGFEAVRDILTRSMSSSVDKHDAMHLGMESAVPRSEAKVSQLWRLDHLVMQRSCDARMDHAVRDVHARWVFLRKMGWEDHGC